jgi:Na+-transporting NADH:ubiquinone oxidoreductase subunit F
MAGIQWVNILISVGFLAAVGIALTLLLLIAERRILNYGDCEIDINGGKKKLTVRGGSSLLSTLSDNGIYIPSACGGRGTCAYCKVAVSAGGGTLGPIERPSLSEDEVARGVRLSCQVKVRSDVAISIPDEIFSVRRFRAALVQKRPLTHDILELRLRLIEPPVIEFTTGQYVQLESREYRGRKAVNRAYSISSIPSDAGHLELIIRRVPEGICTTWIFDIVKEGEEISFSGPYGEFRLSDTHAPAIFIAGGSGMAPIWAMLRQMRERRDPRPAWYFFGALTQRDLFFVEELRKLEGELGSFTFIPALSNEPPDTQWEGERGLITDVVRRRIPDLPDREAYLCGSPGMIDACIKTLLDLGVEQNRIYYDKFS